MEIYIKNMVCDRCVMAVRSEISRVGLKPGSVKIGKAVIDGEVEPEKLHQLADNLNAIGFEILDDRTSRLVESIKQEVIAIVRSERPNPEKLSYLLASRLGTDYKQLSSVFSAAEDRTIEKYFIAQRVERVKELLAYGELTISEIAFRTGYSSAAHLTRQFRQVTGATPSDYRGSTTPRLPLDKVLT